MDYLLLWRSSADGQWRWRYVRSNGRILADSGEGYRRQVDARKMAAYVTGVDCASESVWSDVNLTDYRHLWLGRGAPVAARVLRCDVYAGED